MLQESSWKSLSEKLQQNVAKPLKIKINDNRSTMLSVRWESDHTKVSLHRMFLEAPENIMDELACYLRKEGEELTPMVKAFIEDNLTKFDYSHHINPKKLATKGKVYNLQKIYDKVNREYFGNKLKLAITWFGDGKKKNRSRVNFGAYFEQLKLIKINRLLDNEAFPDYVVEFVIYHEMLHAIYTPFVKDSGRRCVHTPDFKKMERRFHKYREADRWIKNHHSKVFID